MNKKAIEHLQFALSQYRNNLKGVAEYVEKAETNLEQALAHEQETLKKIAELEEVLGDDAPPVEETTSKPEEATA